MFEDGVCKIFCNSKLLAIGIMARELYVIKVVPEEHGNVVVDESSLKLWHYQFSHLGMDNIVKLVNNKLVEGMDNAIDQTSVIFEGWTGQKITFSYNANVSYVTFAPMQTSSLHKICTGCQDANAVNAQICTVANLVRMYIFAHSFAFVVCSTNLM